MDKKVVISIASAIVLCAGGITGFVLYNRNSGHPRYGKYYADDFNGKESFITLDAKSITFNNVDFSSSENSYATTLAFKEVQKLDENNMDERHKKLTELKEEIKETLDFDSIFNGKTFDATDYEEDENGELFLAVYDDKTDCEIWLSIINKEKTIFCGSVGFEYKG